MREVWSHAVSRVRIAVSMNLSVEDKRDKVGVEFKKKKNVSDRRRVDETKRLSLTLFKRAVCEEPSHS